MDWKKLIGFGLLFWMIMFVLVSAFIAVGIADWVYMWVINAIIAGVIGFILARLTKAGIGIGIVYGIVWVIIGLALDYLVTRYFAPDILKDWTLWVGYGVFFLGVIFGSLLKAKLKSPAPVPPSTPGATMR